MILPLVIPPTGVGNQRYRPPSVIGLNLEEAAARPLDVLSIPSTRSCEKFALNCVAHGASACSALAERRLSHHQILFADGRKQDCSALQI